MDLFTLGMICKETGKQYYVIRRIIEQTLKLEEVTRMGRYRLFNREQLDRIQEQIDIEDQRKSA
jgi:hypothetical protein